MKFIRLIQISKRARAGRCASGGPSATWASIGAATLLVFAFLIGGCGGGGGGYTITPIPNYQGLGSARSQSLRDGDAGETYTSASPRSRGFTSLPGGQAVRGEEFWIIERKPRMVDWNDDDRAGSGSLMTKVEDREVALPLRHTDVKASLSGSVSSVLVTQQFQNPYTTKIEAVYVFPLPADAAVNDFIMTIGDRRIRGIIREKAEAEAIYKEAKTQGYVASLLTQERPNIFTQSVANIEPGKEIDVSLRYFHTLTYVDGWYEFVFPMVVGPRFNPVDWKKGVGAVGRGFEGSSGQSKDVSYLRPGEHSGHDISLSADIHAAIEEYECRTHHVEVATAAPDHLTVRLAPDDALPNKDFVFRFRLAGERIKTQLATYHDARGGFFTLTLVPPQYLRSLARAPLELVFVLDCSGSMSGQPLAQAKAAISRALDRLEPGDSFQIINFSESASQLGSEPLEALPYNVERGRRYLKSLVSDGPTEMIEGIKSALAFRHDSDRLRFVCFLTDGFIGNEPDILREVDRRLGESRVFSFGVGSAPNRYLLDSMAKLGKGTAAYVELHDDAAKVMDDFFDRIAHPALTSLKVDWDGMRESDIYPRRTPDLFVGRPVVLTGRFSGHGPQTIHIHGKVGRDRVDLDLPVNLDSQPLGNDAFPTLWARQKIADLYDQHAWTSNPFLKRDVRQTALEFSLVSAFTSFVAVDAAERTAGRYGTTVPVAVPVPEGTKYETTVGQ